MPAYYRDSLTEFLAADSNAIVGSLSLGGTEFTRQYNRQIEAWDAEVALLKEATADLISKSECARTWAILLEYPIPRRQKRVDVIILADDIVLIVECQIDGSSYDAAAITQVEDYALDIRDFHAESRGRIIVPLLFVPDGRDEPILDTGTDPARSVHCVNRRTFVPAVAQAYTRFHGPDTPSMDADTWDQSHYDPVPTILEAAEVLYANQDVREITSSHADVRNLAETSDRLIELIGEARTSSRKMICFVTGVPGAGKTLAGLNAVHNPKFREKGESAGAFLSGNGPLVKVVSEALARDHAMREGNVKLCESRRRVTTFIQNVHSFINAYEKNDNVPVEHAVVFDEAQRAWNQKRSYSKFGRRSSEPELMLSIMDRHSDWAVVVCLVGSGQEIHNGEAGLEEWGTVIAQKYGHWEIHAPPQALQEDSNVLNSLYPAGTPAHLRLHVAPALHLPVSVRSYRARQIANWVGSVIAGDTEIARRVAQETQEFPMAMTRSLDRARRYLRANTRGSRRCGLVASSGAVRLRAYGLEVDSAFHRSYPFDRWFLDDRSDVRSSYQLEVAATEFECQGLELDWVGVCWCNDFCRRESGWTYRRFKGTRWQDIRSETDRRYLENKYRVLLTRAREGTVIWVPLGDDDDPTLPSAEFDRTADYLLACGVLTLDDG